jgi:hypothetical protein
MQPTEMPVNSTDKEKQAREARQRAELLRELDIENKTEAQVAAAKLDRVQLFLFLTRCMDALLKNQVLVSHPAPARLWCQTAFSVQDNVVYAKFGEALMQPIGFLTATEFWATTTSKFLWHHDFAFVDVAASPVDSPFKVTISETTEDSTSTRGITQAERANLEAIAKDVTEVLDMKRPADFKRDPRFAPSKPKAKWGPGELIEKVRTWLQENEAAITARAITVADEKLASGALDSAYAVAQAGATLAGQSCPDRTDWVRGTVASEIAEAESGAVAKALSEEITPYTEAELDDLAWRQEHRDRAVETIKLWTIRSRNFDDRIKQLFSKHPEITENFDNADILGLLASVVTWANTALNSDRMERIIRSTTVEPRITADGVAAAEADMAGYLILMTTSALAALGKNVEDIPDNDPRLLRAGAVISQARIALPAVEARIQELNEVFIDVALKEILGVLQLLVVKATPGA